MIMTDINKDELEFDALEKCYKALSKLDYESKTRVIRYLLDKFKLISYSGDILTKPEAPHPELLDNKGNEGVVLSGEEIEDTIPSVYELVTKQHARSEIDILLVVMYKMSNGGKEPILRSNISEAYKENNLYTKERSKNITNNIKSLIKKSYVTAPNNISLAITPEGIKQVGIIAEGKSATVIKSRKTKK